MPYSKNEKNLHRDKAKIIKESHQLRKKFLLAIKEANLNRTQQLLKEFETYLNHSDPLDLLKRIEKNPLRSQKNFMLSHNSMYALMAEFGGMDPVLSHYLSEKYAILIENIENESELFNLHKEMVAQYSSKEYRFEEDDDLSLSSQVQNYIMNNFSNNITIETIALEFHVSKEHLMRTFKKETDNTINDEIRNIRLKEAKKLLKSPTLRITDIAFMVGFNNSQYFSTVFKKLYGLTPSEFQNRYKKNG